MVSTVYNKFALVDLKPSLSATLNIKIFFINLNTVNSNLNTVNRSSDSACKIKLQSAFSYYYKS